MKTSKTVLLFDLEGRYATKFRSPINNGRRLSGSRL